MSEFDTTTGEGFRDAREHLGLSYRELSEILGGIRPDTIRKKWERDDPPPGPMASQIMDWMVDGYRPPEWPARLEEPGGHAETLMVVGEALQAAERHLSFCSYGDSYEREAAEAQGLPRKIEEALNRVGLS